MDKEYYIHENRQREKQVSREADEQDIVSGKKTREQLRRENGLIRIVNIFWERVKAPK